MHPATPDTPGIPPRSKPAPFDAKVVSALIIQLNILRKNTKIYPDGHPALEASRARTLRLLQEYLKADEAFSLAVTRDALLFQGKALSKQNPIVGEYAGFLHEQSICALTLRRGITAEEFTRVNRLLAGDPKALPPGDSLAAAVGREGGGHAEVQLIEWSSTDFTEVGEINLDDQARAGGSGETSWESFIRRLLQRGADGLLDGDEGVALAEVGADRLAALTGRLERTQEHAAAARQVLADFVQERAQPESEATSPQARFLRLTAGLASPLQGALLGAPRGLAIQAVESTLGLLEERDALLVLGLLERVNQQGQAPDAKVVALAGSLAGGPRTAPDWRVAPLDRPAQEREFSEHVQALLAARGFPAPPPSADPRQALRKAEDDLRMRAASGGGEAVASLLGELSPLQEAEHFVTTLLDLLAGAPDRGSAEAHARALTALIATHAQAGNWGIVLIIWRGLGELEAGAASALPGLPELCRRAKTQSWNPEDHPRLAMAILTYGLDKAEFLSDILRLAGETQGQQIVEAYAQEGREAARAALIPVLVALKAQTLPHVLRLLEDPRPAIVCRMLLLLQRLGDPAPLKRIEGLVARPETEVRLEALRTCAILRSPKAPGLLLRLIGSPDETLSVGAIGVARFVPHPEVIRTLMQILSAPRWLKRSFDLDRKVEAVRALIGMGKAELLPPLHRLVARQPFFHAAAFRQLRLEVFRALAQSEVRAPGDFLRLGKSLRDAEIAGICRELERRQRPTAPAARPGGDARRTP